MSARSRARSITIKVALKGTLMVSVSSFVNIGVNANNLEPW